MYWIIMEDVVVKLGRDRGRLSLGINCEISCQYVSALNTKIWCMSCLIIDTVYTSCCLLPTKLVSNLSNIHQPHMLIIYHSALTFLGISMALQIVFNIRTCIKRIRARAGSWQLATQEAKLTGGRGDQRSRTYCPKVFFFITDKISMRTFLF